MSGRGMQPTYYSQYSVETACSWMSNTQFKEFDRCRLEQCIKLTSIKECKIKSVLSPNRDKIDMSLPECMEVVNIINWKEIDNDYIAINSMTKKTISECVVKVEKIIEKSEYCSFDTMAHKDYVCPDSWGLNTCGTLSTSCYSGPVDRIQTLKLFPQAECSEEFLFYNCKDGRTIKGQECFFRPNGESIDPSCNKNISTVASNLASESNQNPTVMSTSHSSTSTPSTTNTSSAINNKNRLVYITILIMLSLYGM